MSVLLETPVIVAVGRESVGKSQLIAALTGRMASSDNFRGSTVHVERTACDGAIYVDTPGIHRQSDTETTRLALAELAARDEVLLVVQATQLDDDLAEMLPLVVGKRGAIAVTFWDRVEAGPMAQEALARLAREVGVPLIPLDARRIDPMQRKELLAALESAQTFQTERLTQRVGWRIEPKPGWLEHRLCGPVLAVALLLAPALATIYGANVFANWLHPLVQSAIDPAIAYVDAHAPGWVRLFLTARQGDFGYGLLNMGPFLFVWALPTVLLFSVILGAYKASGLVERINVALHPWVRPFGLSGRDIVRVMMGFGCNVPAVISTRACSGCSRGTAVAAIAFGAACSYQLPATLAVLSAGAQANGTSPMLLTLAFLGYLLATTLVYLRLTSPAAARSSLNILMTPRRPFMQWPTLAGLAREAWMSVKQFLGQALPIFVVICLAASLLNAIGVLDLCARSLGPVLGMFDLPAEAALPIVLSALRKDGIFLFAAQDGLAFPLRPSQVLTAVYLAGVLLPCLVTAWTIARETGWRNAAGLLGRQFVAASVFALVLAWVGGWCFPVA